jgi:hypothetical protein
VRSIRDAIIAASRPPPHRFTVPGIDGDLFVRILTVGEIVRQDEDVKDAENKPALARALCRVLCDEAGMVIFNVNDKTDLETVLAMPWHIVRAMMTVANEVNGLVPPVTPAKN